MIEFESRRGFGGGGGLEDDVDGDVDEVVSLDGLRNPTGFLGGGGADATDARRACVAAAVSVFTRRKFD